MPSSQNFGYQTLDPSKKQIRVLVIEAALETSSVVRCTIQHIALASDPVPPYETVSYVWGSPAQPQLIIIEGQPFSIGTNADRVLRRVRLSDGPRMIWMDAVCINQKDLKERSQQVAIMGEVYRKGTRNLVWLGESDSTTEQALKDMALVLDDARLATNDFESLRDVVNDRSDALQVDKIASQGMLLSLDFTNLLSLYRREWFERLWIVQEAALPSASTCLCGEFEIPLLSIVRVARWLVYKANYLPFRMIGMSQRGVNNAFLLWQYADHDQGIYTKDSWFHVHLLPLMNNGKAFRCFDPRDHVYGMLGIYQNLHSSQGLPSLLTPDYKKSAADVLRDAARFVIEERCDLEAFNRVYHRLEDNELPKLPSWVPHWHQRWIDDMDPNSFGGRFRADGSRDKIDNIVTRKYSPSPDILSLVGYQQSSVALLLWSVKVEHPVEDHLNALASIDRNSSGLSYPVGQSKSTLAITLAAGLNITYGPADPKQAEEGYQAWVKWMQTTGEFPELEKAESCDTNNNDDKRKAAEYARLFRMGCHNRQLFQTADGRLGLGPLVMREQDTLAILFGCKWPVILRPLPGRNEYEFVGVAYVHGIMFGEAAKECERAGMTQETFHLR